LSPITNGGTSARAQASVLSLYDSARLEGPKAGTEATTWADLDNKVKEALQSVSGNIVLLTSPIISPSTKRLLDQYTGSLPNFKVVTYEPISQTGILKANEAGFGVKAVPSYHFDKAKTIVSIGCDFLGAWISPIEFAGQYVKNRVPANGPMSRHYQFESRLSQTGANADYRFSVKPSQEKLVVAALYGALVAGSTVTGLSAKVAAAVGKAVGDLNKNAGNSLVVFISFITSRFEFRSC